MGLTDETARISLQLETNQPKEKPTMEPVTPEKENEARCYAAIAGLLGKDVLDLKPENSFTDDLGADSLDTLEIVMHLEAEFDIKISDAEAEEILTIGDAVKRVQKLIDEQR